MSKLRWLAAFVVVVCALSSIADVRLKSSELLVCRHCWNHWADLNGDGLDDLLVTYNKVYMNLGNGRLADPVPFAPVSEYDVISHIADLNGDRHADLMVFLPGPIYPDDDTKYPDGPVRLLIADGNGGYVQRPMPSGAGSIRQVLDFTGDGVLDLLRWDFLGQNLSILRGNGDATFTVFQELAWPFDQVVRDFTPADINGDGRLDLVTLYDQYLHIFYGQQDGKFGPPRSRFTRIELTAAHFADMNGDAKADLIFDDGYRTEAGVTVMLGDGTGRFPTALRYTVPQRPGNTMYGATSLVVGDWVPGGAKEIAHGQMGDGAVDGRLVLLGVVNNQLVELSRLEMPGVRAANLRVVRFNSNKPQLIAFGQVHVPFVPVAYHTWLIETEGAVAASTAAPRRRSRAIGRANAFTGGRYHVGFESDCPIEGLRNWEFQREGMFIDVGLNGPIERAEAVYLEDEGVFVRFHVKDPAYGLRVLEGTLQPTAMGLTGKLFEWGKTPCGNWQVHKVTATYSH